MSPPAGTRPYGYMLAGCVWFSVMGVLAHDVRGDFDWQAVALVRSSLAASLALVAALATGAKLAVLRPGVLWLRSVAGSCSMVATFYALTHLPVSDVLTLTNTFPVWVAVLSWPLAGERPTVGVWGAVVCAVAGVALTQQPHVDGFPPAAGAALAASVFTAVAMLGLNRLRGVSSLGVVTHFSTVAALVCVGALFVFPREADPAAGPPVPLAVAELVGVGVTATVGQVFLTLAYRTGSATRVSVVGLSQVVFVMAYEAAFEGRQFNEWSLVGTALVLGPAAWLMARERKGPPVTTPTKTPAAAEGVAIE